MMETLKMTVNQDNTNTSDSNTTTTTTTTTTGTVKKIDSVSATNCANCGTTTTPLWRRGPNGETICNACGLYLKARNTLRPPTLKRTVHKKTSASNTPEQPTKSDCGSGGTCPGGGQCNGTGGSSSCAGCPAFNQHQVNRHALQCANCRTTTTPLWRRDEQGNTICNACGLYYKLHNVHRPVSMKRSVIKRRKRIIVAQGSDEEEIEEDEEMESTTPSTAAALSATAQPISVAASNAYSPASAATATTITNQNSDSVKRTNHVPEIEDYVVLKKKKIDLPHKKQHILLSPPTTTSPSPAISSIRYSPPSSNTPSSLSDKIYQSSSNSNTPLYAKPYPEQQQQQQQEKSYLPPISSERQSYRLESLFGRRDSNSSITTSSSTGTNTATATTTTTNTLPPLSLPPLTPPLSQQSQQQSNRQLIPTNNDNRLPSMSPPPIIHQQQQVIQTTTSHNGYELADFDTALDRLEHLRRQVRPEQAYALSQLTQSITDLASKAEAILSLDSLAYGGR